MVSTRSALEQVDGNLNESLGVRQADPRPQLSPVPSQKDVGRRPLRKAGRVRIDLVVPDPHQPRSEFSDEVIEQLAASLRDKGQLQPILVRWDAKSEKWMIVAGECRWRAAQRAELGTIDCYFEEGELTPSEILEQQLIENCLRTDLRPIEEAQAYASLMKLNHWNGKQVAETLHIPPSRVSRALALLDLPPDLQRQVELGRLAARSAYELSKLPDDASRRELAGQAATGKLTTTQAAKAVRQRKGKANSKTRTRKLSFPTESGWTFTATATSKDANYHTLELAALDMLAEIRLRIDNNVQLY